MILEMEKTLQPALEAQEQNTLVCAEDEGTVARLPGNVFSGFDGDAQGRKLLGFVSDQASFDAGVARVRPPSLHTPNRCHLPPKGTEMTTRIAARSLRRPGRGHPSLRRTRVGVLNQPGASRRVPATHRDRPRLWRATAHPTPIRSRARNHPLPSPSRCGT